MIKTVFLLLILYLIVFTPKLVYSQGTQTFDCLSNPAVGQRCSTPNTPLCVGAGSTGRWCGTSYGTQTTCGWTYSYYYCESNGLSSIHSETDQGNSLGHVPLSCQIDCPPQQSATGGTLGGIFGVISAPSELSSLFTGSPEAGITNVLSLVVQLIYIIAAVVFVFYLLYSGLQFIYSEGSKETVAEARGRITWAIIGIIFLALLFVLLRILSTVTGFTFFQ